MLGKVVVIQLIPKPIKLPYIGVERKGSVTLRQFHKNLEWFYSHKGDSVSVGQLSELVKISTMIDVNLQAFRNKDDAASFCAQNGTTIKIEVLKKH